MQIQYISVNKKPTYRKHLLHPNMEKLVSFSLYFFERTYTFKIFYFLRYYWPDFKCQKTRLIESHKSTFRDFYYIIHSCPSESIGLKAETKNLHSLLARIVHSKNWIYFNSQWRILKELFFSKGSSNLALKSEYTIFNVFSCNQFILLLTVL